MRKQQQQQLQYPHHPFNAHAANQSPQLQIPVDDASRHFVSPIRGRFSAQARSYSPSIVRSPTRDDDQSKTTTSTKAVVHNRETFEDTPMRIRSPRSNRQVYQTTIQQRNEYFEVEQPPSLQPSRKLSAGRSSPQQRSQLLSDVIQQTSTSNIVKQYVYQSSNTVLKQTSTSPSTHPQRPSSHLRAGRITQEKATQLPASAATTDYFQGSNQPSSPMRERGSPVNSIISQTNQYAVSPLRNRELMIASREIKPVETYKRPLQQANSLLSLSFFNTDQPKKVTRSRSPLEVYTSPFPASFTPTVQYVGNDQSSGKPSAEVASPAAEQVQSQKLAPATLQPPTAYNTKKFDQTLRSIRDQYDIALKLRVSAKTAGSPKNSSSTVINTTVMSAFSSPKRQSFKKLDTSLLLNMSSNLDKSKHLGGGGITGRCAMVSSVLKTKAGQYNRFYRKQNQDAGLCVPRFLGCRYANLFGVYDGHGTHGTQVSQFIKKSVVKYLTKEIREQGGFESDTLDIIGCLRRTYFQANRELLEQTGFDVQLSGCTAVTAILFKKTLYCANTGDSRCVLFSQDNTVSEYQCTQLSRDHKPEIPEETARIIASNGRVEQIRNLQGNPVGIHRVWKQQEDLPGLAMSRSMGDSVGRECGVIAEPDFTEHQLREDQDRYIIVASDGVWDFLPNEQVRRKGGLSHRHSILSLEQSERCC